MNWNNCKTILPARKQEVLIYVNGQYFVAVYTGETFKITDRNGPRDLWCDKDVIYWTELTKPV